MILLETCAGQGSSLGHKFDHIIYMLDNIKSENIGVCWDTCHLYAAGYDIASEEGLEDTMVNIIKIAVLILIVSLPIIILFCIGWANRPQKGPEKISPPIGWKPKKKTFEKKLTKGES